MKNLIILLLIPMFSQTALAKCDPTEIRILSTSNSVFEKSSTSSTTEVVQIPVKINDKWGCFEKIGSFKIESDVKKKKSVKNSIVITPMKTEFVDIPSPHQKQYVFVEKETDNISTKFHTMSFVCSGEVPLSIEARSDSLLKILTNAPAGAQFSRSFAMGIPAQILNRDSGHSEQDETFNIFEKIYHTKTEKKITSNDTDCCNTYQTPSMISSTSLKAFSEMERSIVSKFTTMADNIPNGCSHDFVETMKNYQLENYSLNESLKDYRVSKPWYSKNLVLEWD